MREPKTNRVELHCLKKCSGCNGRGSIKTKDRDGYVSCYDLCNCLHTKPIKDDTKVKEKLLADLRKHTQDAHDVGFRRGLREGPGVPDEAVQQQLQEAREENLKLRQILADNGLAHELARQGLMKGMG